MLSVTVTCAVLETGLLMRARNKVDEVGLISLLALWLLLPLDTCDVLIWAAKSMSNIPSCAMDSPLGDLFAQG